MTPAVKILLEEAQKEIDRLSKVIIDQGRIIARITGENKALNMELDQRKFCKNCLVLLVEESIFEGICQDCCEKGEWKEYAK
jgi:hypothetical protein